MFVRGRLLHALQATAPQFVRHDLMDKLYRPDAMLRIVRRVQSKPFFDEDLAMIGVIADQLQGTHLVNVSEVLLHINPKIAASMIRTHIEDPGACLMRATIKVQVLKLLTVCQGTEVLTVPDPWGKLGEVAHKVAMSGCALKGMHKFAVRNGLAKALKKHMQKASTVRTRVGANTHTDILNEKFGWRSVESACSAEADRRFMPAHGNRQAVSTPLHLLTQKSFNSFSRAIIRIIGFVFDRKSRRQGC
jgi:hypothetical protein